jgi:hypothetical protein
MERNLQNSWMSRSAANGVAELYLDSENKKAGILLSGEVFSRLL